MHSETYILSLKQIAADHVAEIRRKEAEDAKFMASWDDARKNILLPAFDQAETHLEPISECSWTVTKACENGSSVILKIHTPARRAHELRFTADLENRVIRCTSSLTDVVAESFDWSSLKENVRVEQKVLDFVKSALKKS